MADPVPLAENSQETEFIEYGKQVYKIGLHKLSLPESFYIATFDDELKNSIKDSNGLDGKINLYYSLIDEIIDVMVELKTSLYVGKSSILKAMLAKTNSSKYGAVYGVRNEQIMVWTPDIEFIIGTIYRAKNSKKP